MSSHDSNVFDFHSDEISFLSELTSEQRNILLAIIEKEAQNLTIVSLKEILSTSNINPINFKTGLVTFAHILRKHPDTYQKFLNESSIDKDKLSIIDKFLKSISQNGLNGLDIIYEMRYIPYTNRLDSISGDMVVRHFKNEEGNIAGYVPIITLKFSTSNEEGKQNTLSFDLELDKFSDLLESLTGSYSGFIDVAKDYKSKIGDKFILHEVK